MARGGFRPGAGRKKGSKDKNPRKVRDDQVEAEKIRQMLSFGTKARARFYQEFLLRVSKGEKLTMAEKKMMDKLAAELADEVKGDQKGEAGEAMDPLTYMLKVMNDPSEDKEMRARMATAAAPYCHPRKGEGAAGGKKQEKDDAAKRAGSGRLAPGRPPISVVK